MASAVRAPSGAESSTLAERANYIVNIWVVYSGTIQRLSILSRPDMTQTHTLQRGLAGALVIVAGMMGVLVGPASAADGLTPAEITVSADEVANGTTVQGTAQIPVEGAEAGDRITVEMTSSELPAEYPDSATITEATASGGVDVEITRGFDDGHGDKVALEFNNDNTPTEVELSLSIELSDIFSEKASRYNDRTLVKVARDETASGLSDTSAFDLSVDPGTFAQIELTSDAAVAVERSADATPVYEAPIDSKTIISVARFEDDHGNEVEVPSMDTMTLSFIDEDVGFEEEIQDYVFGLESEGVSVGSGTDHELFVGTVDVVATKGEVTDRIKLRLYPETPSVSIQANEFGRWNETSLLIDLGVHRERLGEIEAAIEATEANNTGHFRLHSLSDKDGYAETFSTSNPVNKDLYISGDVGTVGVWPDIESDGTWGLAVSNASPGTYSLTVDVMPAVETDGSATRDTVTFRVHGPVANATGACNRSFVGMAHDPDPLGVTIDRLTDTAGQTITSADVHIDAITVANRSIHRVDAPASALPLTLNVDPTALNESGVGPGPAPVAATLSWTDNGTTHTETVTLDRVDLVHEVATPTPTTADWVPVTAPMPYDRIVYEGARTDAAGAPLEAHWSAEAGYVPFNATAHRRQPLASGWYVAGASRIGYVYAADGVAERTRMLDPGWHLLGPPLDLTERVAHSLDSVLPGAAADRRAHYAGLPVNAPENIDIGPYDTYWVHLNATAEQPLPGAGYDPATRGDRP